MCAPPPPYKQRPAVGTTLLIYGPTSTHNPFHPIYACIAPLSLPPQIIPQVQHILGFIKQEQKTYPNITNEGSLARLYDSHDALQPQKEDFSS